MHGHPRAWPGAGAGPLCCFWAILPSESPPQAKHCSNPGATLDTPVTCLFPPCVQAMVRADASFS